MNRHQKPSSPLIRNPAWRRAFQRLDEALEQESEFSYKEKLELIGKHMFGDLWRERKNPESK